MHNDYNCLNFEKKSRMLKKKNWCQKVQVNTELVHVGLPFCTKLTRCKRDYFTQRKF